MGEPIVLIGGGGHALVVAEAARLAGLEVAGFLDDDERAALAEEAPRLGALAEWAARAGDCALIVAIGDLAHRRRLIAAAPGGRFVSVIHPSAAVSPLARIGRGVFIGPMAVVNPRAVIGGHAIINSGAIIEHDCNLGENCHIAPGAVLGGRVTVGPDALIGLGARVMQGVSVGARATVGAGAAVVVKVRDGTTVVGVPAAVRPRFPDVG